MLSHMLMKSNIIPILLIILTSGLVPLALLGPSTDYCKEARCKLDRHTVCQRKYHCGPVKPCSVIDSDVPFRTYMVQVHNKFRNDLASGAAKGPYGNTGAKKMWAVSYDMEMEYLAACWNNKCIKVEHDECRHSKRFFVGQNIWWGKHKNGTAASVPAWFDEIKFFTDAKWFESYSSSNYPKDGNARGHFTQLIWAETKYIGCSFIKMDEAGDTTQLICNYGPAGNMQGAPVYKMAADESQIASECDNGIKNKEFSSLCGEVEAIPTEAMWAGSSQCIPSSVSTYICSFFIFIYYTCAT